MVLNFRVEEVAVRPCADFVVPRRVTYLLVEEVAVSTFATASNSEAELSISTTCLGVGKLAILS